MFRCVVCHPVVTFSWFNNVKHSRRPCNIKTDFTEGVNVSTYQSCCLQIPQSILTESHISIRADYLIYILYISRARGYIVPVRSLCYIFSVSLSFGDCSYKGDCDCALTLKNNTVNNFNDYISVHFVPQDLWAATIIQHTLQYCTLFKAPILFRNYEAQMFSQNTHKHLERPSPLQWNIHKS